MKALVSFAILASGLCYGGVDFSVEKRVLAHRAERLVGSAVSFRHDPALQPEEYAIRGVAPNAVEIAGATRRARLYGLGRLLRERAFRGTDRPVQPLRGIYFATHFGNWYDRAEEHEIVRYVEDLALWGCNQVRVWFDLHDFTSVEDPKAQAKIKRLRMILKAVREAGLETSMIALANEAFANSPPEVRADWRGGQNGYERNLVGHYHVEICPSKPGGLDLILKTREAVLDQFADIGLSNISFFPYDQGGCTCAACAPWGCNGMLKILPAFAALVHRKMPGCTIEYGTWCFDRFGKNLGEWKGLCERIGEVKQYAECLSVEQLDFLHGGVPGGLRATTMTEISMAGMLPWGGFGANPQPRALAAQFCAGASVLSGCRPYSEGIYEDLNKVLILQLGWNPAATTEALVGNYAAFYFGETARQTVTEAALLMEQNLGHSATILQDGRRYDTYHCYKVDAKRPFAIALKAKRCDPARAARAKALLTQTEATLQPPVRASWRWRILMLRAQIDDLLAHGAESADARLTACFTELARIYKTGDTTEPFLTPPGPMLNPLTHHCGEL